jgi:PST family polysaccharide transporter
MPGDREIDTPAEPEHDRAIGTAVSRGLVWLGIGRGVISGLDLISIVVVLAFWISPSDYGVAMLAASLFAVLDLAADLGLSAAVIQRDDHTADRVSTVFWLNLGLSLVVFGVLFIVGPLLGELQSEPEVGVILIAYGGKLMLHNIFFVPQALMKKELRFKELSIIRMIANVADSAARIIAAALGAGPWFIFAGKVGNAVVTAIGVQVCHPWRPRFVLRLRETRAWLTFGLKTAGSQILFHIYTNIDYQVVGYYFGSAANGIYSLAYMLVLEPARLVSLVVLDVAFPTFARLQHKRRQLTDQFVSFSRLNLVIVMPVMVGLLILADDLLALFWGPEWAAAAAVARVLCLVGVLRALSFVAPPLLDGLGRPTLTLVYMITASVALTASFVGFAVWLGPDLGFISVGWAWVAGYPIAFAVLFALTLGVLQLSVREYARRIIGVPLCIAAAGILAEALHLALAAAPTAVRSAAVAALFLGATGYFLARFQGMGLSAIKRSI